MKHSEILYGAHSALIGRGWARGFNMTRDGRMCLMGAIAFAETGDPRGWLNSAVVARVRDVIGNMSPISFNDLVAEDANDVLAVLQIAGDIAAAEGN